MTDRVAYLVYTWVPRAANIERCTPVRAWLKVNRPQLLEILGMGGIYNPEVPDPENPSRKPRLSLHRSKGKGIDPETGIEFDRWKAEYRPTQLDEYEGLLLQMWWLAEHNDADFLMMNEDVLPTVDQVREFFDCDREYCTIRQSFLDDDRFLLARFKSSLSRFAPSWSLPYDGTVGGHLVSRIEAWLRSWRIEPHVHAVANPSMEIRRMTDSAAMRLA